MPPIKDDELMQTCMEGPFTAGGLDAYAPIDLTLFPLMAFTWLAFLLNAIENGKSWPKGMLHGKASFLQKDPDNPSMDPLDFRILLLLSVFYRKWAKHRLKNLSGWIAQWDVDALFAGVHGRGG